MHGMKGSMSAVSRVPGTPGMAPGRTDPAGAREEVGFRYPRRLVLQGLGEVNGGNNARKVTKTNDTGVYELPYSWDVAVLGDNAHPTSLVRLRDRNNVKIPMGFRDACCVTQTSILLRTSCALLGSY